MKITATRTRLFKEGENLEAFIVRHYPRLCEGNILVVTSKIAALAEGRTAFAKNKKEKEKIIRAESEWAMPAAHAWLTIKDGTVMVAAGIDESNADGKLILLPKDSFSAAARLRATLRKCYRLNNLGVLITDSRTPPLRAGVMGMALGYAGFRGVKDCRGSADLFGKKLRVTKVDIADSLAAAAVLLMGEGAERRPLAVIKDAPVEFTKRTKRRELVVDVRDDVYMPLFKKINSKRYRAKRR